MDQATTEAPPVKPKGNGQRIKHRIKYALAATLLASGADREAVAKECGAANWNVLRVGLARHGVTPNATRALQPSQIMVQNASVRIATQAAEEIRDRLNRDMLRQAELACAAPLSYRKLASKGQGHTAMLKTLAESFRAVNGGADQVNIVFGVSSLRDEPVIDVAEVPPASPIV